jgi:hypothetical protein
MGFQTRNPVVRAKRAAYYPNKIAGRAARGEARPNEQAVVRMGTAATQVLIGQDDLSTWDDEELRRGRRRHKSGAFLGKDPMAVPKALHDELVRRTLAKANKLMVENLQVAIETLTGIVVGADVEPKDKLVAIRMIMDRVMGKDPQKIEIGGEAKWQIAIQNGIVSIPEMMGGDPDDGIIDVESVYDEEDEL